MSSTGKKLIPIQTLQLFSIVFKAGTMGQLVVDRPILTGNLTARNGRPDAAEADALPPAISGRGESVSRRGWRGCVAA
jgi:hypothetical protein